MKEFDEHERLITLIKTSFLTIELWRQIESKLNRAKSRFVLDIKNLQLQAEIVFHVEAI